VADAVQEALGGVAATLIARGRDDLAARVRAASARATRPATVVAVVGEFKQGKSLLVNALLGRPICPVDDDLSTAAVTIIQYGASPSVHVHRRSGNRVEQLAVEPRSLADWVTEAGSAAHRRDVERAVVSFDHPLLAQGLTLVDTPGAGGLTTGHAKATTAFLPYADALIFATDASAELSKPEIDFLRMAVERCPQVIVALTKIDLYPAWRKILDLDRQHLTGILDGASVLPTSAAAAIAAIRRSDADLAVESGVPQMRDHVLQQLLDRTRKAAVRRSLTEAIELVDHMAAVAAQELEIVRDPARISDANAAYEHAVANLEQVRGPGARWGQMLADRMADLSSAASFRLRGGVRDIIGSLDHAIEELRSPADWEALSDQLQDDVAALLADVFGSLDDGAEAIYGDLMELLTDEASELFTGDARHLAETILSRIESAPRELGEESGAKRAVGSVVPALRGAQSGLMMFGLLGRVLPIGAAGLLMSNPVTLVIGAAFAGKQVISTRQRTLAVRRQQARASVRRFLDDIQFETSHELTEAARRIQRVLRDVFTARIVELQRTYQAMAEQAKRDVASTYEQQVERGKQLENDLAHFRELRSRLVAAGVAS